MYNLTSPHDNGKNPRHTESWNPMNLPHKLLLVVFLLSAPVFADDSVDSLLSRASAYEVNQQHELATELYKEAVAETTVIKGRFTIDLFEPLLGLSRSFIAQGYLEEAKETLSHAQQIAHRNEGVYSLRQLEVIDHMTDIALKSEDVMAANNQQKFSFFISEHHYGKSSLDVLPAYYKLVEWYLDTGQNYWLKRVLENAIDLIRAQAGDHDARLIEFLRIRAKSRRLSGACCSERLLAEVLEILANSADLAIDIKSAVYLELGDAYTASGKTKQAAEYYALGYLRSRGELSRSEPSMIAMAKQLRKLPLVFLIPMSLNDRNIKISDGPLGLQQLPIDERSRTAIGSPIQFLHVQLENILPFRFKDLDKLASIAMTLDFTVTREGTLRNVELKATNAPDRLNRLMLRVLAETHYRPALVDGTPVDTEHVTLRQTFKSDYPPG